MGIWDGFIPFESVVVDVFYWHVIAVLLSISCVRNGRSGMNCSYLHGVVIVLPDVLGGESVGYVGFVIEDADAEGGGLLFFGT